MNPTHRNARHSAGAPSHSGPFPPGAVVDIYTRCSTGDQKIDSQLSFLRKWFGEQGITVGEIFTDEARTGTSVAGRSDFLRMVEKLRRLAGLAERPAGVAFWDFKRFARDYDDAQYYKADLRRLDYVLHSVTDNIPPGLLGRLVEAVHDYKNALFVEELRADIIRELNYLTQNGYMTGGVPPTGYKRSAPIHLGRKMNGDPKLAYKMEIDPAVEPIMRKAWQMKLAGATNREIHAETHLLSSVQHFSKCFSNPVYAGAVFSGTVLTWGAHEGYVTREEFEYLQARRKPRAKKGEVLKDTSQHGSRRMQNNPFLLSGIMECGLCNYLMSGTSNKHSRLYRCDWQHRRADRRIKCEQKSILAEAIHVPLVEWLATDVLTYEHLQAARDEANAMLAGNHPELDARREVLCANRQRANAAIANLTSAIEGRGYVPQLQVRLDERIAELRAIETELAQLNAQARESGLFISDEALRVICDSLSERLIRFVETNAADMRNVVQSVIAKVELFANAMIVHYSPYTLLREGRDTAWHVGNDVAAVRRGLYSPQKHIKTHTLTLVRPHRGPVPLDASPYLPLVLNAVRQGAITSRQYADLRGISINTASFHFAGARRANVITPLGHFSDGIHYRPAIDEVDDE